MDSSKIFDISTTELSRDTQSRQIGKDIVLRRIELSGQKYIDIRKVFHPRDIQTGQVTINASGLRDIGWTKKGICLRLEDAPHVLTALRELLPQINSTRFT